MAKPNPTKHSLVPKHTKMGERAIKELLEKYGECSILVYNEQVVGTGDSLQAAIEDAERNLPPEVDEITPIHEWLGNRHPFLRALPGHFEIPHPKHE